VGEFFLDLLLPETDRAVFIQWGVMAAFWPLAFFTARKTSKDTKTFLIGLAILNLAWFAARTIH